MTRQIQKVIEELGYTAKEAKVYLAALALGECHLSDVAARVGMPRTSVQVIVDKLYKAGLLNFYVQRRYKYWVAENPARLLLALERKERSVRDALPQLTALRNASRGRRARSVDALGPLRIIADASEQAVLMTNKNAEIVYVNAAWEKLFGYSLSEIQGENPRILQSGKTPREVHTRMWRALQAGKMFLTDEIIDRKKNGKEVRLLTTIVPLTYAGQTFFVQILDDLDEHERAELVRKRFERVV